MFRFVQISCRLSKEVIELRGARRKWKAWGLCFEDEIPARQCSTVRPSRLAVCSSRGNRAPSDVRAGKPLRPTFAIPLDNLGCNQLFSGPALRRNLSSHCNRTHMAQGISVIFQMRTCPAPLSSKFGGGGRVLFALFADVMPPPHPQHSHYDFPDSFGQFGPGARRY